MRKHRVIAALLTTGVTMATSSLFQQYESARIDRSLSVAYGQQVSPTPTPVTVECPREHIGPWPANAVLDLEDSFATTLGTDMEVSDPYLNPCPSNGYWFASQVHSSGVLWAWTTPPGESGPYLDLAEIGWRKICNGQQAPVFRWYFSCCNGNVSSFGSYFTDHSTGEYLSAIPHQSYTVALTFVSHNSDLSRGRWFGVVIGPGIPGGSAYMASEQYITAEGARFMAVGGETRYLSDDMGVSGFRDPRYVLSTSPTVLREMYGNPDVSLNPIPNRYFISGATSGFVGGAGKGYQVFSDIHSPTFPTPTAVVTTTACSPGW